MSELSSVKKNFIKYINNSVLNNKISHAYMIEVDNYDTDLKYVYNFIKMILCNMSYDDVLVKKNDIIELVDSDNYPDIFVISSETSNIKKSAIVDLQKEFNNKSLYSNYKIYIIKEAEKLNDFSSNTILKFLEEPEDNIIAFLLTDNKYHLLDTIISRCQLLNLKENTFSYDNKNDIIDLLELVISPNNFFINYNHLIKNIYLDKNIFKEKLITVENIILEYLSNSSFSDTNNEFYNILSKKNSDYLINVISIIEDEIKKLSYNINYKLWINSFFSRLIGG